MEDADDDRVCEVAVLTLMSEDGSEMGSATLTVVDGDGQDMESEPVYTKVEDRLLSHFGVERSLAEVVTPW